MIKTFASLIFFFECALSAYNMKILDKIITFKSSLVNFFQLKILSQNVTANILIGGENMTPNFVFILTCAVFSFTAALIKQLYDLRFDKKSVYTFIIDVLLSGISGVILALILSEFITNSLTIIGLSGLGGIFGMSGMKIIMKLNLGKRIKIQIGFDDEHAPKK